MLSNADMDVELGENIQSNNVRFLSKSRFPTNLFIVLSLISILSVVSVKFSKVNDVDCKTYGKQNEISNRVKEVRDPSWILTKNSTITNNFLPSISPAP